MPKAYNIHNPTPGVRMFHDGIEGSQRLITLLPDASVENVELSDAVAGMLRMRFENDVPDVILTEATTQNETVVDIPNPMARSASGEATGYGQPKRK